ncbi:MAG: DUF4097 family beta strand repeat-containing protein [Acidobacteriota bacterium]|nr:DUF4097 family beta strand repeat-containing protein [Acidobacteriota bacterium]
MASYPPPYPPPPPGYDPRDQRRFMRDQARAQIRAQRDAFRAQREQMRYQMRSMRRGSILGPLILIAIGVVFLLIQTGRLNNLRFWDWYGRWWPLLLVIAGCAVLAEWALDQYVLRDPQRPAYRRTLGGGVVFLLLFFVATGVVAGRVHGSPSGYNFMFPGMHFDEDSLDQLFGDKHESDETMDLSFEPGSSLEVMNPRGSVTVKGTSDDGKMHIAVHKQVYSRSDSDADSRAKQFKPDNKYQNSVWKIAMPALDGASADLILSVPPAAGTTVTVNHGDIHIASIKGSVTAIANHGNVELSAITGMATAHVNSGSASVSARSMGSGIDIQGHAEDITIADVTGPVNINGEFFGTTHLEHVNGAVHFHTSRTDFQLARLDGEVEISPDANLSADQALGPVVLTTHNRNINLDRVSGDVSVTNRNGTIDLIAAPAIGTITLENRNGAIKTTLPEHSSFSLQAETNDGDAFTEFSLPTSSSGNHKTISGSIGSGGPTVRLSTTNSDVTILKSDVQPLPPIPPMPPKITLTPPAIPAMPASPRLPKQQKLPAVPKAPAAPAVPPPPGQ